MLLPNCNFCMYFRTFATVRNPTGHEKRPTELMMVGSRHHRYHSTHVTLLIYFIMRIYIDFIIIQHRQ